MKRKITLALLLVLMLALAGCNGCNGGNTNSGGDVSAPVSGGDTTSAPVSNSDDGVIDLDAIGNGESTTSTTGSQPDVDTDENTNNSTVPTAGDFDDPGNFIEVPLG